MVLRELVSGGRRIDEETIGFFVGVASLFRKLVRAGVRERSFRRVDPFVLHFAVMGSLLHFFATTPFRARLERSGRLGFRMPDAGTYVEALVEHHLRAVSAVP